MFDGRGGAVKEPTFSVVLPTYNSAGTLRRAMDSVLRQSFADWELVLVDDASTDATEDVVRSSREALGGRLVHVRRGEQGGSSVARNCGIDRAGGRFIAFLDADDEFIPHKLERQMELLRRCPELGLVFSDYAYVNLRGERRASVFDDINPAARAIPARQIAPRLMLCGPELADHMTGRYIVSTITGVVRRSILGRQIRFLAGQQYSEEWLFFLEVAARTRGGYVNEALSLHHHTMGSVSRTDTMRNNRHQIIALERILERYPNCSSRARADLYSQLATSYRQLGFDHYKSGNFKEAQRYLRGALKYKRDWRGLVHVAQALWRGRRQPAAVGAD